MNTAGELVARLAKEGIDPTLLSEVAEALFTGEIETRKLAERRKNERQRKARSRDVTGQDVTDAEVTGKVPAEVSPHTPLPTNLQTAPLKSPRKKLVEVPDWIPAEPWEAFKEMRRKMRSVPFTETAERGIIADLERGRSEGHDPAKMLMKAVKNGHRAIFPDETTRATKGTAKVELSAQQLRERAEWFVRHGKPDDAEQCRRKAIQLEQRVT